MERCSAERAHPTLPAHRPACMCVSVSLHVLVVYKTLVGLHVCIPGLRVTCQVD
jgi:hypothetical protein